MAIEYLSRDPGMAAIIADLQARSTVYTVTVDSYFSGPSSCQEDNSVRWNPMLGVKTSDGGVLSPALVLGHELAHLQGHSNWRSHVWWPGNDNLEERRVITGPERAAAITLGESIRTDHAGNPYPVQGPTSREPFRVR